MLCIHTIDTPYPLHNSSWVPGDIIVDNDVRTVEVGTFRENICCDEKLVIIFGMLCIRIEVSNDLFPVSGGV